MRGERNIFAMGFYLLVLLSFLFYGVYLFFVKNSAVFSYVSIIFVGFLVVLCLIFVIFLISSKVRNMFMLE